MTETTTTLLRRWFRRPRSAESQELYMKERHIEEAVMRFPEVLGCGEGGFIRHCRIGRGFGSADLVYLPDAGTCRLVIVEAKSATAADAASKVLGQLLMYYAGALRLGARGIRLMRAFAELDPARAKSERPKSLKALSGGVLSPPTRAWEELCKGRKLKPSQVAIFVALDSAPPPSLAASIEALRLHHGFPVRGLSVATPRAKPTVW